MLRLGQAYGQPLGIISADKKIANMRLSLRTPESTARQAIEALLKQIPGYDWTEERGVFVMRPRALPPSTKRMLGIVIPRIAAENISLDALNFRLWMEIQLQVDPERKSKGFMGFGHDPSELGRFDLKDVTVEDVLDEIVRRRGNSAWVALPPPDSLKGVPPERLWNYVTYSTPARPLDQLCCLHMEYFQ